MPKKLVKVTVSPERAERLRRWYEIQPQLEAIKAEEHALREAIVLDMFDPKKLEGVQTIDLGNGWRLKADKKMNITATNESGQIVAVGAALQPLDEALANSLVRWKPEVSTKVYREVLALAETHQDLKPLLFAAISVKPGMPELTMVPPKAEETTTNDADGGTTTVAGNVDVQY